MERNHTGSFIVKSFQRHYTSEVTGVVLLGPIRQFVYSGSRAIHQMCYVCILKS